MGKFLLIIALLILLLFTAGRYFNRTGFYFGFDLLPFFRGNIELTSPDFNNGDKIPAKFTCDGGNESPDLLISGVPGGTKSLAIVLEDASTPVKHFTHWLVYDLDPATRQYNSVNMADKGQMGINDFGNFGYSGPCPPTAEKHRYYFKVFALSKTLEAETVSREAFENSIKGNILGTGLLVGVYSRNP